MPPRFVEVLNIAEMRSDAAAVADHTLRVAVEWVANATARAAARAATAASGASDAWAGVLGRATNGGLGANWSVPALDATWQHARACGATFADAAADASANVASALPADDVLTVRLCVAGLVLLVCRELYVRALVARVCRAHSSYAACAHR